MHATFRVNIDTSGGSLGLADFETTIDIVPTAEMDITGGPWEDVKKVRAVTYDIIDKSLLIYLDPDEIEERYAPNLALVYRESDWKLVGQIADR